MNGAIPRWLLSLGFGIGLVACNPYDRYSGEVNAGPVDPVGFPAECLGAGGDHLNQGTGAFVPAAALAHGTPVEYFQFNFSAKQLAGKPLSLQSKGAPNLKLAPPAYIFDPGSSDPLPTSPTCKPQPGTALAGDVPNNEQGTIFTSLPAGSYAQGVASSTSYIPVVSEVPVISHGETCQEIKSETTLVSAANVSLTTAPNALGKSLGVPNGQYAAFAVIDPGAAVFHADGATPATGLGLQHWGWYGRYLLAYLNGGYIPMSGGSMVPQTLYYPRSNVTDATGTGPGAQGAGYDVLDAVRGEAGYSPVCAVMTYDAGGTLAVADLPQSAADINTKFGPTLLPDVPAYIFCLQVQ